MSHGGWAPEASHTVFTQLWCIDSNHIPEWSRWWEYYIAPISSPILFPHFELIHLSNIFTAVYKLRQHPGYIRIIYHPYKIHHKQLAKFSFHIIMFILLNPYACINIHKVMCKNTTLQRNSIFSKLQNQTRHLDSLMVTH